LPTVQFSAYLEECQQQQHQEFFSLASAFRDAVKAGEMPPVTQSAVDALADYTVFHFAKEEEFMEKTHYVGMKDHHARHLGLIDQVKGFQKAVKSGSGVELPAVTAFINEMTRHDRLEDGTFFDHLREHAAK
jgi:hemerythrin-like metal-binding protein